MKIPVPMQRHHVLPVLAVLAALLLPSLSIAGDDAANGSLKQAYADDFLVGVALDDDQIAGREPGAQALVLQQFGSITAENGMKPEHLHPAPGVYDFSRADAFVAFGRRNHLFVVGHTLLWHVQTPGWMFTDAQGRPNSADVQLQRLRDYIGKVAGHYAGQVQAWDVANEVIDEDGSYRQSPWLKNVGDGDRLLREAFAAAARADPQAELYYNDFNTFKPEKRAGIVRLVKMLQAAGLRIDGIGMQGHWGIDGPSIADIEQTIDMFAALGVKVMITELDVDMLPRPEKADGLDADRNVEMPDDPRLRRRLDPYVDGLPADAQQRLATRYAELFALFHRRRDVISRVTFWGLHDGQSWKNGFPVKGRTNHPLLFDRQLRPKPALDAVLQVPAHPR